MWLLLIVRNLLSTSRFGTSCLNDLVRTCAWRIDLTNLTFHLLDSLHEFQQLLTLKDRNILFRAN